MGLFATYHVCKIPTGTPPARRLIRPQVIASVRIDKTTATLNGGITYKTNDAENRLKDRQPLSGYYGHEPKYRAGRNEPCPCLSGLKFKKCCIDKTR